jgi:hypothetical protein
MTDLPLIHRSHLLTTQAEVTEQIIALALEHPAHGCNPFEALLMIDGQRFQGGASTDPIQRKRVDRATSAHATKATSCSSISW